MRAKFRLLPLTEGGCDGGAASSFEVTAPSSDTEEEKELRGVLSSCCCWFAIGETVVGVVEGEVVTELSGEGSVIVVVVAVVCSLAEESLVTSEGGGVDFLIVSDSKGGVGSVLVEDEDNREEGAVEGRVRR